MNLPRTTFSSLAGRILTKRCPRCGRAPIFKAWFTLHERCGECDYEFDPRPGDTWAFWYLTNAVFVGVCILVIYLGFQPRTLVGRMGFAVVFVAAIVASMPHRKAFTVTLDYLIRSVIKHGSHESEDVREGRFDGRR